ncbi:hypothetical protein JCM11251_003861 [Rhodosporidiobolus azoricus]
MSGVKRVRGVSVFRPIVYGNSTVLLTEEERAGTDHTHRWTVGVRSAASPPYPNPHPAQQIGGADDLSYMIKKVTFKLYETYKNPLRSIEQPPFEVTETGWGEFDIVIKVFFVPESNEKPLTFNHHLKLHPWPVDPILYHTPTPAPPENGADPDASAPPAPVPQYPPPVLSPVHSWQYEEIVFTEPTETFYGMLLENKPTPLPRTNRHPRLLTHPLSAGGNIGEFSVDMEDEEGQRLDKAKQKTLDQIEEMRKQLLEYEQELGGLKKEVEQIQQQNVAQAATATAGA